MSDARRILDERLAKGEISETEYDRLRGKLDGEATSSQSTMNATPSAPSRPQAETAKKSWWGSNWWKVVIGVLALSIFLGQTGEGSNSGLTVGNVSGSGDRITMIVTNSSSRNEDIVIRIRQNEIEKCVYKTRVRSGNRHTIRFNCPNMRPGTFKHLVVWASSRDDLARIARRIN